MNERLQTDSATTIATESVAEAYLALLKDRGIDHLYVGAGTDTAPVIEAYAGADEAGLAFPKPILAVHENVAVGMAHGYYMISRRPQAVMLHVTVGAANAVCGLLNAVRAQVPILFTAGRTPLFEQGRLGSRTHEVHWAQEMFDQGGMVRELVKWDYELRDGLNAAQVIDRALSISMAEPRGPVYLTLPREVLAQPQREVRLHGAFAHATSPHPDPDAVCSLARAFVAASCPVVLTSGSGADPTTVPLLVQLAERFGIGVLENRPRYLGFPSGHDMHLGYEAARVLPQADALLCLETDVPWIPSVAAPRPDAFVAHAGADPLFSRYPIRSFGGNLAITANAAALLRALIGELENMGAAQSADVRREALQPLAEASKRAVRERAAQDEQVGGPITKLFLSRCIDAVRPAGAIVINEYPLMREQMTLVEPGTFFQLPSAGGLGWGMPAALGAKQAAPERTVIAALGDGAYLFANPAACHQASAMHGLPLLTVVYNNECWAGVQQAATGMYPGAHSEERVKRDGAAPLSSLKPLPDFERYAEASGGWGARVTEREHLLPTLQRALEVVEQEGRQALVNVIGV